MRPLPSTVLVFVLCTSAAPAAAQWPPAKLENLRVLPDTIPPRELIALMADFTRALGVRCTHCHVGEEGRPLATYDFPSDEKATKRKAREMLRMVIAINGRHLTNLEERADPPVRVQCVTCHAGRTTPRQLEDVLVLAYAAGGIDSARAAYDELRERYYGRAAYDFGSVPLTIVADTIRNRGSLPDAVAVLVLNVEMNPTSVFAKRQHGHDAVLLAFRTQGVDAGVARYHALRDAYGTDGFPEFELNDLGYALLRGGNVPEAVAAFTLTVEAFPRSANAYDSLGEAYVAAGDTTKAIVNYRRSLELNPRNANAEKVLRALGARR